jgi:hypothetical protein
MESLARQIATVDREMNPVDRSIQAIRKSREAQSMFTKISGKKDKNQKSNTFADKQKTESDPLSKPKMKNRKPEIIYFSG